MRLTEYIEEAIQDLMQARTYITTNSITVARRVERELTKGQQFAEIESDGADRLSNNHNLYNLELGIRAVSKLQEDLSGADNDALWADISDFVNNDLTTAALQSAINTIDAASGITIAGFDFPGTEIQTLEQYEYKEQRLIIALTFTP